MDECREVLGDPWALLGEGLGRGSPPLEREGGCFWEGGPGGSPGLELCRV